MPPSNPIAEQVVSNDVARRFTAACTPGVGVNTAREPYNPVLFPANLDTYAVFEFAEAVHGGPVTREEAMVRWRAATKADSRASGALQHASNFQELVFRGVIVCANSRTGDTSRYRIDHEASATAYLLAEIRMDELADRLESVQGGTSTEGGTTDAQN